MQPQPLFFAPTQHEKTAGYKMPVNPKFWQSEIIRYLKSMHPYLPMEESEIDIRRMDATKGSAVGSVVLGGEIAIPVIIMRPRPGADPELAPMDVFFHKGRYHYLDPDAIKQLAHKPQIGEPEGGRKSNAHGGNPYVGDMTGDATPLEYSGQASPFAGPFDGSKMSMDLSMELMPQWMLEKTAGEISEKARVFGISGAVGGAVRGAITGTGGLKGRLTEAVRQGAVGGVGGAAGGAAAAVAGKGVKKREDKKLKAFVKKEVKKQAAADFSIGLEAIVEGGHVAHLIKEGYLDPNDISNFRQLLATNPHILQGSGNNFELVEIVARRGPDTVGTRANVVKNPNIMQVYKGLDGQVCIKFSNGPETKTSPAELKAAVGDRFPEVMSKLKSGSVYMEHDGVNQASWDTTRPMFEAKSVTRDGLYSIRTKAGETITGMVCQAVMGFDGKTLPLKLFVTPEGKYALAGELFGVRLNARHRLPSQVPTGGQSGVFVNYVHGTPISTLPIRLVSVRRIKPAADGDARTLYIVQNPMTGERYTLSPVQGVQGFERMHVVDPGVKALADGDIYYMPGDSEWVALRNPVDVAQSEDELSKLSSVDDETRITFSAGLFQINGKVASIHDLSEPAARETLMGMGMETEGILALMESVRERPGYDRGVKIAGLHEPDIQGFEVIPVEEPSYDPATIKFAADCRPGADVIKAAAESGHPETLDSILSLEFITPQNLRYFIDNIPDFEEAATRLAALLIAVRLGMPHVAEQPVKDALEGLAKTINKLNILKSASDHKNERAASATT